MSKFYQSIRKKHGTADLCQKSVFHNESGAIDLASIMVGIIVIGLTGGVIAATVFAVIPWAQDNAAKQQLDSVSSAQSAYKGLSSSETLSTNLSANSYADSYELKASELLSKGNSYCTVKTDEGQGYEAYSQSSSGKTWMISDKATKPTQVEPEQVQSNCGHMVPYDDKTPAITTLTYKCDTTKKGVIPMNGALTGVETWTSIGAPVTSTYNNKGTAAPRTLDAGVEYKVTFDGTYNSVDSRIIPTGSVSIADCLRSVDYWGKNTKVTSAAGAFYNAINLTSVPANIPESITSYEAMFFGASNFNSPNVSSWKTSKVTHMGNMFDGATIFNQPVDNWDVSNVSSMSGLFAWAKAFNQPLNDWDTSKVISMSRIFSVATSFNQPLDDWNVSNVLNLGSAFNGAEQFNQPLENWDVSGVYDMNSVFNNAKQFDQPLNSWNVSRAYLMTGMFSNATKFNQPLNNWNVSKVIGMDNMFNNAPLFSQDISGWNTAAVTSGAQFAPAAFPNNYMPAKTSK